MERVSISLEDDVLKNLEEAARKEKRSRSNMAAMLIERALSCQDDDDNGARTLKDSRAEYRTGRGR